MRKFRCEKCQTVSTIKQWNTYKKAYKDFTLHEIKDYGHLFGDVKERVRFICPTCDNSSSVNEIEEIKSTE